MQVFQAVKDKIGDTDRPPHFSIESIPEDPKEVSERNGYLLSYGITPIWFPKGCYDYIEQILRLARNEIRYNGHEFGKKKEVVPTTMEKVKKGLIETAVSVLKSSIGI